MIRASPGLWRAHHGFVHHEQAARLQDSFIDHLIHSLVARHYSLPLHGIPIELVWLYNVHMQRWHQSATVFLLLNSCTFNLRKASGEEEKKSKKERKTGRERAKKKMIECRPVSQARKTQFAEVKFQTTRLQQFGEPSAAFSTCCNVISHETTYSLRLKQLHHA